MSFLKIKSDSYCVGGRHRSATSKIYGDITSKIRKVQIGYCSVPSCNGKKSEAFSDNTIQVEGLGDFVKNCGKKGFNVFIKIGKNDLSNPTRTSDITANNANAAASRNPKKVLSTLLEVINFLSYWQRITFGENYIVFAI